MSNNDNALERLGKIVAAEIRDSAISNFDRYLSGQYKGQHAERIRHKVEELRHDPDALLHNMIPTIVDETITIFLQVLDEYLDTVVIKVDEGEKLVSPYEYTDALGVHYDAEDEGGWITMYSKQRRVQL